MSKISLKVVEVKRQRIIAATIVMLFLFALPVFSLSSHRNNIYVDDGATGSQNGSSSHPYKNINEALKHANSKTDIHVANGSYKENFTIKKGVKIFGESQDGVVVTAKTDKYAVARMKDDTTINKVTLRGGKWGIEVNNDSKVSIVKCTIKYNDKDGIHIEEDSSDRVSISDSEIRNNGRAGIYSKKRKLSLTDNKIIDNKTDGIDIEAGSDVYIEGSNISSNGGSGLKVRVDGSKIWTKNNTARDNGREGIEVIYAGKDGRVDIKTSSYINNGRYGVAKIQTMPITAATNAAWARDLTFTGKNSIFGNDGKDISSVIVRN
jgi:hypothetical protein